MKKKTFLIMSIAAILLVALGIVGYLYLTKWRIAIAGKDALEKTGEAAEKLVEDASKGVLPDIGANPLENKPDVNPVDKANPFKDIKTNPFE